MKFVCQVLARSIVPRLILPVFLLVSTAALAQVPAPVAGSTSPPARELRRVPGPLPVFDFYSRFWINLHHVLYEQARLETARPTTRSQTQPAASAEKKHTTEKLSDAESRAWSSAVAAYEQHWAKSDLLFDTEMVRIKDRLEEIGDDESLQTSGLTPDLVDALERAAPVYRAHWWVEDDRANRDWIADVAPLVERLGAQLAREHARVYRVPWPAGNIRVDVCTYAGLFGGYTTLDPLRVTVSSRDARNQREAALEVLFHESSHALAQPVRDAIVRDCRARNKPIPRDLWHALLFYTTGEIVRRNLATLTDAAPASYQPYAYRQGLYVRDWQNYERALEQFWRPYLEGRDDFDDAVARLVNQL
jgi:hypothetical protein